ncbi:BglG family transcription antiterminator [Sporosarcina sp. FSL K6-3457]|uniref:BglG family transcription antiterminator n=1 Tax=Sporosarcina sp. FSL K6-3457 TaxID=2978204 RepID=UPI0030F519EC
MNIRQVELLNILLTTKEKYTLIDQLAEQLGCSEKTIRNDLKTAAIFCIEHSSISLERKPGCGIFLLGPEEERQHLVRLLQSNREKPTDERVFDIAYQLLTSNHPLTLQDFADQHFTNKTTVKKDLDYIADWLQPFGICLHSKQKVGIFLDGEEARKRSAMAHLSQLAPTHKHEHNSITRLFPAYEVNFVKSILYSGGFSFTDETFDRLIIHILIMIKRIKQKNPIIIPPDSQQITEQIEYQLAQELKKKIEPFFSVGIPDSEVIYLAWHLMSGKRLAIDEVENPMLDRLVNELITEMTRLTKIDFTTDITLFQGLSVHLQPALNRISYQLPIKNPLLTEIKNMYPYMFSMVIFTLGNAGFAFSGILPEDEAAYIALHFQASVERRKQRTPRKKRAIIVCHHGIGMSHLLRSRIERQIPGLQIEHCMSRADISKHKVDDFDLIISTMPLPEVSIFHIVISALFDLEDQERLHDFVENNGAVEQDQHQYATLQHFIVEDAIHVQVDLEHRYEVVEMLANSLYDHGLVKKEYIHSAILRERASATSIGSSIAIPHGNPPGILQSSIAVAVLKRPIEWGTEYVSLVFLLAVVNEDPEVIKKLFNELSLLSEQTEFVKKLSKQTTKQEILNELRQ